MSRLPGFLPYLRNVRYPFFCILMLVHTLFGNDSHTWLCLHNKLCACLEPRVTSFALSVAQGHTRNSGVLSRAQRVLVTLEQFARLDQFCAPPLGRYPARALPRATVRPLFARQSFRLQELFE